MRVVCCASCGAVRCVLIDDGCGLFVVSRVLFVVYWLLFGERCLLAVVRRASCCVLCVCCAMCAACCPLFVYSWLL